MAYPDLSNYKVVDSREGTSVEIPKESLFTKRRVWLDILFCRLKEIQNLTYIEDKRPINI
ncbi:MAG: hypothetical protein CM15mP51_08670 [Porticoccaceae bacterium]|nr:MAG: hypothetical protein CM15mP51_08670 [Porticoccaceae bacterium]